MSRHNKAKRAAKQKARARGQAGGHGDEGTRRARDAPPVEMFTAMIRHAALDHQRGRDISTMVGELTGRYGPHARLVGVAADLVLRETVSALFGHGWQPYDVYQIATRQLAEAAVTLVVDALAAETGQRATATVHPRWHDQLARIGAAVWWDAGRPQLTQWAERHGQTPAGALRTVITVLARFATLPALPEIPLPEVPRAGVDEKMLARVRALLAKAESTQFPEEAEALSAKAQELMSRYSFEQALVDPVPRQRGSARRVWLDNPYLSAKSSLVSAVASANRCRAVSYENLGFVAVVGHEVDLDIVELLVTSLLVQATEAMLAAGRQVGRGGQSRTRSFRQSFLLAYAARIRERLTEANRATGENLADERLLPVLAKRSKEVDALFEEMFPDVVSRRHSISNGAGWYAGRTAADQARLGVESGLLAAPT